MLLAVVLGAGVVVAYVDQANTEQQEQQTQQTTVKDQVLKPQETCPIKGSPINKTRFVDVNGYRIYVCCPSCIEQVKKDPAKAIATLKERGEAAEVRLALCTTCGEIKGTEKCCAEGAEKCAACSKNKGSVGCCLDVKEQALCAKCGEIEGSAKCGVKDAVKCEKCGKNKGAPGCCNDLKKLDILLCPGCGELKGSEKCCTKDALKCEKCGLSKGSPGCCKLPKLK